MNMFLSGSWAFSLEVGTSSVGISRLEGEELRPEVRVPFAVTTPTIQMTLGLRRYIAS